MSDPLKPYSKRLSFILRHKPESVGLTLEEGGWLPVDALLRALSQGDDPWSPDLLATVVETNGKKRFEFSDDGRRIRARQGHSKPVDLGLKPVTPPDILYHGTVHKALDGIQAQGLRKMKRHHVHLSADLAVATQVGGRRGKAIILAVDAAAMAKAGALFYVTDNGVWLTDAVPWAHIDVMGDP